MDKREIEILTKLLALANPPPTLHRYRKPNEWALAEISKQQIFLPSPDDLNDPFECFAPVSWNVDSLRQDFIVFARERGLAAADAAREFESRPIVEVLRGGLAKIRKESGIICLSAVPDSIRMWSYYAQQQEGICIGFDTKAHPFMAAMKVLYQNPDAPLDIARALKGDATQIAAHISLRKAAEWEFEQEYRIPIGMIENGPRLVPFDPSAIIEIRLGVRVKNDFKRELMAAISNLPRTPKLIQMRCDLDRFVLTEEIIFR